MVWRGGGKTLGFGLNPPESNHRRPPLSHWANGLSFDFLVFQRVVKNTFPEMIAWRIKRDT